MVEIIEHSVVSSNIISEIVSLKSLSWNYTEQEHIKWIDSHLKPCDIHFLFFEDSELVAYANLVKVSVSVDNNDYPILGVGNVCTKYKGYGYGGKLMDGINQFLIDADGSGLLFCRSHLVEFYRKYRWKLLKNLHSDPKIITMSFNFNFDSLNIKYTDRIF